MQGLLWAFSSGSFSSAFWPALPPLWGLLCGLVLCLPGLGFPSDGLSPTRFLPRLTWLLMVFFLGMLWASLWGQNQLRSELPIELDKRDYLVQGEVIGLPNTDIRRVRFEFRVDSIQAIDSSLIQSPLPIPPLKTLLLSWYGAESVKPGQSWQFVVRLRHPRGFANPGGFDYRTWLFRRGISATGYVRESPKNVGLSDETKRFDRFRYQIAEQINQLPIDPEPRALLVALSIGDKQSISPQTWQLLQTTGTVHLAVISGLHIGLAALLGSSLGYGLGRLALFRGQWLLPRQVGVLLAWLTALIYAALAGFSLPTLRAFIMLSVFVSVYFLRRHSNPFYSLLWAWTAVSVVEPLAMLTAGFWLSFTAVAVLISFFRARPQGKKNYWVKLKQLILAQWVLLLGMSGVMIFFLGELSLLMPWVNVWAVPWIGFVVVPLCLLGVGVYLLSQSWAEFFWFQAGRQLEWFYLALSRLSGEQSWIWTPELPVGWQLTAALIFFGLLLMSPRGLNLHRFGLLLIFAVLLADNGADIRHKETPLALSILDVGQGLAVVVETPKGVLVYDTGAHFSDRFNAGSGIIAPYLKHLGRSDLRMVIVSHSDRDHSGGLEGLLSYYQPEILLHGTPGQLLNVSEEKNEDTAGFTRQRCLRGMAWQWGEVSFSVLHPDRETSTLSNAKTGNNKGRSALKKPQNNNSCVVLVRFGEQTILLTGDIEKQVEKLLLKQASLPEKVTVLVAPHHGSKSSSSPAFVRHVAARHVVYSAAYNHHFGHPHANVVARYEAQGARQWNTALWGAIRFKWGADGSLDIRGAREGVRAYWQARVWGDD